MNLSKYSERLDAMKERRAKLLSTSAKLAKERRDCIRGHKAAKASGDLAAVEQVTARWSKVAQGQAANGRAAQEYQAEALALWAEISQAVGEDLGFR
jgi:hypothetical protein